MPMGVRAGPAGQSTYKESGHVCHNVPPHISCACGYRIDCMGANIVIDQLTGIPKAGPNEPGLFVFELIVAPQGIRGIVTI